MNFDSTTLREIDRLFADARIRFKLIEGRGVVYQIRELGKTLFEGTEEAVTKKFNYLKASGIFGSEFFEMGAGV